MEKSSIQKYLATLLIVALILLLFFMYCENNGTEPSEEESEEPIIVYITKTGSKYHRSNCQYLRQSKISISLKDAKASGYTPCSVCKPPVD